MLSYRDCICTRISHLEGFVVLQSILMVTIPCGRIRCLTNFTLSIACIRICRLTKNLYVDYPLWKDLLFYTEFTLSIACIRICRLTHNLYVDYPLWKDLLFYKLYVIYRVHNDMPCYKEYLLKLTVISKRLR